jgi:NAD(P)-dependent dehydrogenase (short-subunit alcohol dehydrogenase family)
MTVLRDGLLEGRAVAVAGRSSADIAAALDRFGARVEAMPALDGGEEERVGEWARSRAPLHALVYVAGGEAGLEDALAGAGVAVREVATGALIPGGAGGKIVLVAPADQGSGQAGLSSPAPADPRGPLPAGIASPVPAGPRGPLQAGLENLARTLSVEWARFGVTVVAVAPGPHAGTESLAELVCFLVSFAGDYITGTRLDLGLTAPGG